MNFYSYFLLLKYIVKILSEESLYCESEWWLEAFNPNVQEDGKDKKRVVSVFETPGTFLLSPCPINLAPILSNVLRFSLLYIYKAFLFLLVYYRRVENVSRKKSASFYLLYLFVEKKILKIRNIIFYLFIFTNFTFFKRLKILHIYYIQSNKIKFFI